MINLDMKLEALQPYCLGEAGRRMQNELEYARRIDAIHKGEYSALLEETVDFLLEEAPRAMAVTRALVEEMERRLSPMQAACKAYSWLLAGHAHIDMNWLWPMETTVSIVLNTFRTMLNLMREYPQFRFSQSQASTYAIVEEHDPEMLEEIKARIHEGRWEVTASSWVEPDHNMPSLESEIRHPLYTRRYLARLLDIPEEGLDIDFEPDTFGHNAKLPDVLSAAGVRYLYHCRGEREESLYRWRGRTGREVLVFRDPDWYGCTGIGYETAQRAPFFCQKYDIPCYLTVYGVGDHGGGPTRQDLNMILECQQWPIFPTVKFATLHDFFTEIEKRKEGFPLLSGERNSVYSGCYTTQTRIKRGNAQAERILYASEAFSAFACRFAGGAYRRDAYESAWRKVLFNHFHDILPGSGIPETRDYALGQYQQVYATAHSNRFKALAQICGKIDTRSLRALDPCARVENSAVGYSIDAFQSGVIDRPDGLRIFHLFNPLPWEREQMAEIVVWDFPHGERIECVSAQGEIIPHQVLQEKETCFGGRNTGLRLLLRVKLPACGYTTLIMRKRPPFPPQPHGTSYSPEWRREEALDTTLENDLVRVRLDETTGRVVEFLDKRTGEFKCVDGGFDFVEENPDGMSAWTIGPYMKRERAARRAYIRRGTWGPLRQSFDITEELTDRSTLRYRVSLDQGSPLLTYDVTANWREFGSEKIVPMLLYGAKLTTEPREFSYRIAGGTIARPGAALDRSSHQGMLAGDMALLSDCKYGFRGRDNAVSVTLIRSSYLPDPIPEMGEIYFRIGLGPTTALERDTLAFLHHAEVVDAVSGSVHGGEMPLEYSFLRLEGEGVTLAGIKLAEDNGDLVLHLASDASARRTVRLSFPRPVESARQIDLNERAVLQTYKTQENQAVLEIDPHDVIAVRVALREN